MNKQECLIVLKRKYEEMREQHGKGNELVDALQRAIWELEAEIPKPIINAEKIIEIIEKISGNECFIAIHKRIAENIVDYLEGRIKKDFKPSPKSKCKYCNRETKGSKILPHPAINQTEFPNICPECLHTLIESQDWRIRPEWIGEKDG